MGDSIQLAGASRFSREMTAEFKTRSEGDDLYIEGYFSVFDSSYQLWDDIVEHVRKGAFEETLQKDDIRALINHDTTLVLGRNTAGTLHLEERDHGLFGRVLINPKDQDAMNAYARVERGDVTQCSFGFDVLADETEKVGDVLHVYLTRVKLYEVSICTFPAYEDTGVSARNAATLEARRKEMTCREFEAWKESQLIRLGKGK